MEHERGVELSAKKCCMQRARESKRVECFREEARVQKRERVRMRETQRNETEKNGIRSPKKMELMIILKLKTNG